MTDEKMKNSSSSIDGSDVVMGNETPSDKQKLKKDKKAKKMKKEHKSEKKNKKKRKHDDVVDGDDGDNDNLVSKTDDSNKNTDKQTKKTKRVERKQQKAELFEQVPKVDEHGIAYTKIQIRRMMKRVKRGLHPIETPKEAHERQVQNAQLRREEEAEFAGLYVRSSSSSNKKDEEPSSDAADEEEDHDDNDDDDEEGDEETNDDEAADERSTKDVQDDTITTTTGTTATTTTPNSKKKARSKPVPADYVCSACQNKHEPVHWIYDCPSKVTMRGSNQKKKRDRGVQDPDSRKLFVSGLPFEYKRSDVETLFESTLNCGSGKVTHCKLVTFGDTGRCNGQAYVSLSTDEAAQAALQHSGMMIDVPTPTTKKDNKKKKTKKNDDVDGEDQKERRKQLKLKITRVKNRRVTKKKKS